MVAEVERVEPSGAPEMLGAVTAATVHETDDTSLTVSFAV
jgi:hypothetical protein